MHTFAEACDVLSRMSVQMQQRKLIGRALATSLWEAQFRLKNVVTKHVRVLLDHRHEALRRHTGFFIRHDNKDVLEN